MMVENVALKCIHGASRIEDGEIYQEKPWGSQLAEMRDTWASLVLDPSQARRMATWRNLSMRCTGWWGSYGSL